MGVIEKIFGKKSTGIVYLICTGFLLLSFASAAAVYFLWKKGSFLTLIGFAIFTVFEIVLMSLPVFVQKKFRLYIPPAVEICICLSSVLFLVSRMYPARTDRISMLVPLFTGFTVAMTVFCILHSLADSGKKYFRKLSSARITIFTFLFSFLLILLFNIGLYAIAVIARQMPPQGIRFFLSYSASHLGGILTFCVIGAFSLHSSHPEKFRFQSFQNASSAQRSALENNNKTQYAVIRNISRDDTDYKKLLRGVKAKFLFGRIIYLVLYAGYLVYASISFARWGTLGIVVILSFAAGFVLISMVYTYEYHLFRSGSPNQRLRKLKIAKTIVRVYTLLLLLTVSFLSDYKMNEFSILFSNIMALVNLGSLFYNLFGKPKNYPAARETLPEAQKQISRRPAAAPQSADLSLKADCDRMQENSSFKGEPDLKNKLDPDASASFSTDSPHSADVNQSKTV